MDAKGVIKKIIAEEVAKLLDEDYESVREIKSLANEVILFFAEQNIDRVLKHAKNIKDIGYFNTISIPNSVEDVGKYNKLQDFLIESKLLFMFRPKNRDAAGDYSLLRGAVGDKFDPREFREITLYYDEKFMADLQKQLDEYASKGWKFEKKHLYFFFHLKLLNSLAHEIQHAYDDYRSKGRMYDTKEFREYMDKYSAEKEIVDKQEALEAEKQYFNFPHEVWARFTQAILKTDFTSSDLEEAPDKRLYLLYKMRPLKSVLTGFFNNFFAWGLLFDKNNQFSAMQKRLIHAVVQFWHKEQDRIKEANKTPEYFT